MFVVVVAVVYVMAFLCTRQSYCSEVRLVLQATHRGQFYSVFSVLGSCGWNKQVVRQDRWV